MKYRNIFSDLILEIESSQKIYDLHSSMPQGLSPAEMAAMERNQGITLDEGIKHFYEQLNGVDICWRVKMDSLKKGNFTTNDDMVGSIHILKLDIMLDGENKASPWKENLWFDFMDEKDIRSISPLRPFDLFNNDEKELVAFKVEGNHVPDKLFYYSLVDGVFNFKMNIEDYVNALTKVKGFLFWHRGKLKLDRNCQKELNHFLPQIFGR